MDMVSEFIVVLPRAHKKQKVKQYYCTLCKCGLGDTRVDIHLEGIKHSRRLEVVEILPTLQQHGIGRFFLFFDFHMY
jgi:hypothetical protein